MEDISRVQKKPASADDSDKKVIDLTPDMEIGQEKGGKIYDLTQTTDGTVYPAPGIRAPHESQAEESAPQSSAQPEITAPPVSDIEKEIDAAFENIEPYSPIDLSDGMEKAPPIPDELDDLKQMADDILSETTPVSDKAAVGQDEQTSPAAMETPAQVMADEAETAGTEDGIVDLPETASPQEIPESLSEQRDEQLGTPQMDAESGDEEIIELLTIVPAEQSVQASPGATSAAPETDDQEDDIIELVDIVSTKPQPAEMEDATGMAMDEDGDGIIELTDVVNLAPGAVRDESGPQPYEDAGRDSDNLEPDQPVLEEPEAPPVDDQVIQLSDILSNAPNRNKIETPPDLDESEKDDLDEMQNLSAEIGMVLEDRPAGISDEAIEAAIERYIRARYDGDLESMIAAVVEKAVSREIEHLKRTFMDENGDPE